MRTLNKEEMLVVYIALMICRQLGYSKPPKRQVLNVVESWRLMKFRPDDLEETRTVKEPKWRNDLAWARKELVQRAWVRNVEIDVWELSERGIEKITAIAKDWAKKTDADPSRIETVSSTSERLTRDALMHLRALGHGEKMVRTLQAEAPSPPR